MTAPPRRPLLDGRRWDVVTVLTVLLVLVVGVPANLVVEPLGAAGGPASLFGAGCFLWWALGRVDRRLGLVRGRQPMHVVAALFVGAMLCGYAAGMMRVALPLEVRGADRALLRLVSTVGILLLAADGLRNRADLDRLLRRISLAGGVLALIGLVQFAFGIEVNSLIKIPGLSSHAPPQLILERSSFRRVPGTTSHPIEFGVTLAMLLPIALHCASTAVERRGLHWGCVALIAATLPLSVSRAAMLGLTFVWIYLIANWDARRRINALIITPFALGLMRLAVPGLLGTIKSLFAGLSNDPSISGRTQDYEVVSRLIAENPLFGRGYGTFIPGLYLTLDNQYLGQILETGYVGLVALVVLLGSGIVLGWKVKRRARDPVQHSLGVALSAAAMVPFVTFIAFDGMGFPVVSAFTFLVLGCAGAATRLYPPGDRVDRPPPAPDPGAAQLPMRARERSRR